MSREVPDTKWFDTLTIRFDKLTTSPSKVEGRELPTEPTPKKFINFLVWIGCYRL